MKVYVRNKKTFKGDGFYIGRPSALGNPFSVKEYGRYRAIEKYLDWLEMQLNNTESLQRKFLEDIAKKGLETGKVTLICWCKPLACHGDFLRPYIEDIAKEVFNV